MLMFSFVEIIWPGTVTMANILRCIVIFPQTVPRKCESSVTRPAYIAVPHPGNTNKVLTLNIHVTRQMNDATHTHICVYIHTNTVFNGSELMRWKCSSPNFDEILFSKFKQIFAIKLIKNRMLYRKLYILYTTTSHSRNSQQTQFLCMWVFGACSHVKMYHAVLSVNKDSYANI